MISFECPECGKKHTARYQNAGRRGFCDCGAVMLVPGLGAADQNKTPKLIGHIDLHSAERHSRYIKIGGTVIGFAAIVAVVCALYFRNAWERDNGSQLLTLKAQADALVQAKEYEKAKGKYDEVFGLLGDRVLTDEHMRAEIESARVAVAENNKKVETILAARAETEREKQLAQNYLSASNRPSAQQSRVGRVNYSLVETCKSSWQREGWKYKPRSEQAEAINLIQQVVETDCPDRLDREATLDYIQNQIGSW